MTIGSMVAKLGLDSTNFESGTKSAANSLNRLAQGAAKAGSALTGIYGKLAAFAGIGAFGVMTSQALGTVDATAKMAKTLGMATESWIKFSHAAKMAGVDQNQVSDAMTKFQRRMAFGAGGGGAAIGTIKKLKLDAAALASMDPTQAFVLAAEKIKDLPNQSEKMAAAFQLFGNSGKDFMDFIDQGGEGLASAAAEAERLGLVFSDFDASKVSAANAAMDRLKASISGVFQQIAISIAPTMAYAADSLTRMTGQVQREFRDMASFALDSFTAIGWGLGNLDGLWELLNKKLFLWAAKVSLTLNRMTGWALDSLSYMAANVGNAFVDMGNLIGQVFTNMTSNIAGMMSQLWKFISTGGREQLMHTWTPLLEGFESTMTKFDFEKGEKAFGLSIKMLEKDFSIMADRMADSAAVPLLERWKKEDELMKSFSIPAYVQPEGMNQRSGPGSAQGPANWQVDSREGISAILKSAQAQQTATQQLTESKKQTALLSEIKTGLNGQQADQVYVDEGDTYDF